MEDEEFIKRFKEKFKMSENCGVIYTDVLRMDGNVSIGIGIVIEEEIAYDMSIDKECSVFTGELLAVEKALGLVLDNQCNKDVLILSDSQAVIKELQNINMLYDKSAITCTIRDRIKMYREKALENSGKERKLVIGWVLSHSGITGNENACEGNNDGGAR